MGKFDLPKNDIFPIYNFKTLTGNLKFDEEIVAFDNVNEQLYVTTKTKMYLLKQNGSEFIPKRIW